MAGDADVVLQQFGHVQQLAQKVHVVRRPIVHEHHEVVQVDRGATH